MTKTIFDVTVWFEVEADSHAEACDLVIKQLREAKFQKPMLRWEVNLEEDNI